MNKKLLFTLLAGTFLSINPLHAQEIIEEEILIESPEPAPKHFDRGYHEARAAALANRLGLTDEQKAKAEEIREDGHKKIAPLMDQMMELRKKIDTERRNNMQEFEKILTPEQLAEFEIIKNKMHRFEKGPRHEGEGKMIRGLHQIKNKDVHDKMMKEHHKIKDHNNKKDKHHKEWKNKKGGFIDKNEIYQGGGFVEK